MSGNAMRIDWRKWNRIAGLAAMALAIVLHAALKHHLAGSQDAAAVFTLAGAAGMSFVKVALLVVLRLLVVLVIPGVVLAEAGLWAVDAWRGRAGPPVAGPVAPHVMPSIPPPV
jgi:hypothetical protein